MGPNNCFGTGFKVFVTIAFLVQLIAIALWHRLVNRVRGKGKRKRITTERDSTTEIELN